MSMRRSPRLRMPKFSRGMTLIELLIALAIVAVLIAFAVQGFSGWTRDMVVRSSAESILTGLQIARSEALKRNRIMHFQLVSTLGSDCALNNAGPHWVVSRDAAAGKCEVEPANPPVPKDPTDTSSETSTSSGSSDASDPYIVQKYNGSNAFKGKVEIAAQHNDFAYDGMGRLTTITAPEFIDIGVKNGDDWERYLRIQVMPGGGVRMCNPASSIQAQKCPDSPSSTTTGS